MIKYFLIIDCVWEKTFLLFKGFYSTLKIILIIIHKGKLLCLYLNNYFAFYRFLTSVTYSLPFTLMAAWILFIAAFVKKLVQEKDLRLYEVGWSFEYLPGPELYLHINPAKLDWCNHSIFLLTCSQR